MPQELQSDQEVSSETPRDCKAKIRFYGGNDVGLIDAREFPEFCFGEIELARWNELRNAKGNEELSTVEVTELVLQEDLPAKILKDRKAASKFN